MRTRRKRYSAEFKREAIRRAGEEGMTKLTERTCNDPDPTEQALSDMLSAEWLLYDARQPLV